LSASRKLSTPSRHAYSALNSSICIRPCIVSDVDLLGSEVQPIDDVGDAHLGARGGADLELGRPARGGAEAAAETQSVAW
jgi:hypothetical protein